MGEEVCLITGASSGIGAGIARALASRFRRLALVARRRRWPTSAGRNYGYLAAICQLNRTQYHVFQVGVTIFTCIFAFAKIYVIYKEYVL